MVLFNINIHDIVSNRNTEVSDFQIVNIKSTTRIINCKVNQGTEIIYFPYYTKSTNELYLFLEIFNGSPLWNVKYEYAAPVVNYVHNYRLTVKIIIESEKSLIHEYLNISLALNCLITNSFDDESLFPIFEKTDFSTKSFISYENPAEPPNNFKIKLYEYQKKSLAKMIKMEKGETEFKVKYTVPLKLEDIEYIYDPISCQRINEEKFLKINIRGGILSDEMGLGKTITSVALIASNPARLDHPAVKFSNDFSINKLFSKATLILCPSHLIKQWETEIKRCLPKSNVLTIVTKKDMDKLKVHDIQTADIILTSHQFLMNFKYYPTLHYRACTPSNYDFESRKQAIKAVLVNLSKDETKLLTLETPIFEFFFFHRVILDEGHEIFGEMLGTGTLSRYMSEWVSSIDACNYWYISGTPFINFRGVKNSGKFINLKLVEEKMKLTFDYNSKDHTRYDSSRMTDQLFNFLNKEYIWANILSKICIRHRKVDVENQIQIPGYEEKLIWLKFTELEKQLYDAKKGKVPPSYLQQLCCHPMVIESTKKIFGDVEVDLNLMQDKLITYHQGNYDNYKKKLGLLDPTKHEYHMLKKTYETHCSESFYMLSILNQMKTKKIEESENCSICLDKLDNPAVTACGHIFCYECLKLCLGDKKMCPMCKANLSGKEILVTNKKAPVTTDNINPLINKYGSKLGKTISIIRTLVAQENTRIIIFSQWDDMLSLIGKTLVENGIGNCFVKGNVWSRNSAINKFKAGKNLDGEDNKVIMLSLKNAASGTNLTEATHIIFIEPINASSEECRAIEGQAMCRACRIGQKNKVSVIRILIEGTVEEEIYKKSYNKDVKVEVMNDDIIMKEIGGKMKEMEV